MAMAFLPSGELPDALFLLGFSSTLVRDVLQHLGIPARFSSSLSCKHLLTQAPGLHPAVSMATSDAPLSSHCDCAADPAGVSGMLDALCGSLRPFLAPKLPLPTQIVSTHILRCYSHTLKCYPQLLKYYPLELIYYTHTQDATHTLRWYLHLLTYVI